MYFTAYLMGGLGNQLFQIFATIALALQNNKIFKFEYSDVLTSGIHRPTYWNTLLSCIKPFTTTNVYTNPNLQLVRENGFEYNEFLPAQISLLNKPVCLHGYFQSEKYFVNQYKNIIQLIELPKMQQQIKEKTRTLTGKINVSLHFRLGDYVEKQGHHPVLPLKYYINALKHFEKKTNVIYFCEDADINTVNVSVQVLSRIYPEHSFIRADVKEDWEQLLLMSVCDHNIIANSSFSWWGAYFNTNPSKIVLYPSVWFGPLMVNTNTVDLCPASWTKVLTS